MSENKKYSRVYVEITNICNRSCSFCPGTKRAAKRMSRREFALILERLSGITEYIYLHVMGEPLTHPELCEFIRMANERGFKCSVTTNGTLLHRRCGEIIEAMPYKINVSVHSFEDGTREEYVDYINSCIDFADKASRAGILTVLRLWNKGYDKGRNIDTLAMLKEYFENEEWREGAMGYRIRHKLHLEYGERFEWPDTEAEDFGDRVFCHGLGDHFGILSNGTVIPCCLDREGAVALGNIYTDNISDILNSDRAMKIKIGFENKYAAEELCRRCGYARRFKI